VRNSIPSVANKDVALERATGRAAITKSFLKMRRPHYYQKMWRISASYRAFGQIREFRCGLTAIPQATPWHFAGRRRPHDAAPQDLP
jgi:hypothetical protein